MKIRSKNEEHQDEWFHISNLLNFYDKQHKFNIFAQKNTASKMSMFRFLSLAFILVAISSSAQDKATPPSKITKGKYYFYWGWNRGSYTNSDIHFKGTNYNFTLNNVVASDKQSKFNLNTYLNPIYATIPQFDARFGYNISEHYSVS